MKMEILKGDFCYVDVGVRKDFPTSEMLATFQKQERRLRAHLNNSLHLSFSVSPSSISKINYLKNPNVESMGGKDTCIDNLRLTIFFLRCGMSKAYAVPHGQYGNVRGLIGSCE